MSKDHKQHQKNDFNPDYDAMAVLVEENQRLAKHLSELKDWEAIAADQAMTIAMMKSEQAGKQEPVAYMDDKGYICNHTTNPERWIPLYTTPPQREWVPLTNEEILEIDLALDAKSYTLYSYTRAIEAKLKEKNAYTPKQHTDLCGND